MSAKTQGDPKDDQDEIDLEVEPDETDLGYGQTDSGIKMPLSPEQFDWLFNYAKRIKLAKLDLSERKIKKLPPSIGLLEDLRFLNLYGNELHELPEEIGKLKFLESLHLSSNNLSELPLSLFNLSRLECLSAYSNHLKQLPDEIKQLKKLKELHLGDNKLTLLPDSIGQLENLETLDLSGNRVSHLPVSLGELPNLESVSLDENPTIFPPEEIVRQGSDAIIAFLRDQVDQRNRVRVWRSKLVVAGEGGVGKTNLLRALRNEPFDDKLPTTHFLELGTLKLNFSFSVESETLQSEDENIEMQLNTWDFGGQEIYHATHQFFLTNRSMYLVLWNARLGYEQGKVEYWLDAIKSRAPDSPILLVATHIDERDAQLPLEELRRSYPSIVGVWRISNKTGEGINELRSAITVFASDTKRLPLMGESWPLNWHKAAEHLRGLEEKYISSDKVIKILKHYHLDGHAQKTLRGWLHMLGEVLDYPDDPNLRDLVILKPQWVTAHISRILDSDKVAKGLGLLNQATMQELWHDIPRPMQEHFLHLMERFDLSYRTLDDEEISIIVERLSYDEDPTVWEPWHKCGSAWPNREVCLRFKLQGNIPAGIPTWFIARQHRFSQHKHWRFGALLGDDSETPQHLALIRAVPSKRYVELAVRGPAPHNFFALLRDGFELTLRRFPGLEFDKLIPCPGHGNQQCAHMFQISQLERRIELEPPRYEIECPESNEDVDVRRMLFGLSASVNTDLIRAIEKQLMAFRESTDRSHAEVKTLLQEQTALLHREFLLLFKREQSADEALCPRVFTLWPSNARASSKKITGEKLMLQLYCEEPGCWHSTGKDGRYEIKLPPGWLEEVSPYLKTIVELLRFAIPIAAAAAGVLSTELEAELRAQLHFTKALAEKLPKDQKSEQASTSDVVQKNLFLHKTDGVELRAVERLLLKIDPKRRWGGLARTITPEGHCLWLCQQHAEKYRR